MMEQTRIYRRCQGVRGRAAGRPRRARAAPRAVQPAGRRAARGSRRSTSTRCSPRPSGCWRSTPGSSSTTPTSPSRPCPGRRSAPTRPSTSPRGRCATARAVVDPADPSRGRAAAGRVPRDALRAERLAPLLPAMKLERASPTSGSRASASSTTTARWRWSPNTNRPMDTLESSRSVAQPPARVRRRRVRIAGPRRLAAARPRDQSLAPDRRHRSPRADPAGDRHDAAEQHGHDPHGLTD